jgi:acetyltransferase-like isoleucine patch superfamily enzyme
MSRTAGLAFLGLGRWLVRVRDKSLSTFAAGAFAEYGRRSVIQRPVRLSGEGRIAIGSDVFIGAGSWLQVLARDAQGVAIAIGDGTSMAGYCVLSAARSIQIGQRVLMARNVYIADHMHGFADTDEAVLDQDLDRVAAVEIGDGAWLGQNVVVGPGVRIGRGAVVGANSVALSDVPDFTVVAGAPARVIRTLAGPTGTFTR